MAHIGFGSQKFPFSTILDAGLKGRITTSVEILITTDSSIGVMEVGENGVTSCFDHPRTLSENITA